MHILAKIEPRAVKWEIMKPGKNQEEKENNAKYVISVARKINGNILCVWDQIVRIEYK